MLCAVNATASGIYQWRDADGRLHFGDQPPDSLPTENLSDLYNNTVPFEFRIDTIDYRLPPQLRDRLTYSVRKIFTIYRQALNIDYPTGSEFKILIYGQQQEFRAYQREVAPVLENAAGFYSSLNNQITTWAIPNHEALIRLIIHECSHAISASTGKYIPTWLNEGLAEYFERLHVHGLSAEIPLSEQWLTVLRRHRFDTESGRLTQIIEAPHQLWYANNGPDNLSYAASWSLVWFLMDSSEGRALIRELLSVNHNSAHIGVNIIEQHWPGGMSGLDNQWRNWLTHAKGRHRY